MDCVLCLGNIVRKAQVLIKLESMGIGGRMFNWVLDFLKDRNIEVWVGATHSRVYPTENGVPQESVCSPLLFSIMINDIFSEVDASLGRSLYADDGALWVISGASVSQLRRLK